MVVPVTIRAGFGRSRRCPWWATWPPEPKVTRMTRSPVRTVESAPEGDTLKALGGRFGKVLNIHGAMAHSPVVLETYAAIQEALDDTGTGRPRRTRD